MARKHTKRPPKQAALIAAATTYLEELDDGDIDDTYDAVQEIEEYLDAIAEKHTEIREQLAAARAELLGEKKAKAPPANKRAATKPAPAASKKPASRKVKTGTKYRTEADRIGGTPPFELTYAYSGEFRHVTTLRAHMRMFFRVAKRAVLDDVAAIYDDLLAASGPFRWLQKTTSQLYGSATPSTIARARTRFACPASDSCYIDLKDCELADDVAERRLVVVVHPRGSHAYAFSPSAIQLTFAPGAMDLAFRDRFIALCARLPSFLCGTAGYYLETTHVRPVVVKRIIDAALAHRGVELPGVANGYEYLKPSWISGVNWLTAVGAGARNLLGATSPLAAPIGCHRAGDVLVIQAGPRPELGADGVPPPIYKRVHDYISRDSTVVGLPTTGDDRVNDWHRRYV